MMSTNNTCILFFTRTPEEEAKFKILHPSKRKNLQLLSFLYQNTLNKIQKSHLEYRIVNNQEQIGDSFGERLSNAIDDIFNDYENIIVLGNDCPDIHHTLLQKVLALLNNKKQVIGQEKDGGAYLFGLRKKHWKKEVFAQLPWNTKRLFESAFSYFESQDVQVLDPVFVDIDNFASILGSLTKASLSKKWITKFKNLLLQGSNPITSAVYQYEEAIFLRGIQFRGPPLMNF